MPWTVDDVDRFKKGLTDEQKKKWVAIANGVLSRCVEQGGKQDDCEAKAIRIANSTVGKKSSDEQGDGALLEVSHRPWSEVDKTKLPKECFLWVEDPEKKSTWHLPYREGAGGIDPETGMYRKAGAININAVRAALAAIAGARTGKPMNVPEEVKKKIYALAKRLGIGEAAQNVCHMNKPGVVGAYKVRLERRSGKDYIVAPVVMLVEGVHNGSHGAILHLAEEFGRFPGCWNGIPVLIGHPDTGTANVPELDEDEIIGRVYNTHLDGSKLKAEVWLEVDKLKRYPAYLEHLYRGKPIDVSVGVFTDEEEVEGYWDDERYEKISRNHRPDHLALLFDAVGACSWDDGCGVRQYRSGDLDKNLKSLEVMYMSKKGCKESVMLLVNGGVFEQSDCDWLELLEEEHLKKIVALMERAKAAEAQAAEKAAALQDIEARVKTYEQQIQDLQKKDVNVVDRNAVKKEVEAELLKRMSEEEKLVEMLPDNVREKVSIGMKLYAESRESLIKEILRHSDAFTKEELEKKSFDELEKMSQLANVRVYRAGSFVQPAQTSNAEVLLPTGLSVRREGASGNKAN